MKDSKKEITEESSLIDSTENMTSWEKFKMSVKDLSRSPNDLWLMFFIKVLGFSGFSVLSIASSIYFTEVLEYSDFEMGMIFAAEGVVGAIFHLTLGTFPDRYGIRFSLYFANINIMICFIIIIFLEDRYIQVIAIVFFIGAGQAVSVPTTKLAVKRYTMEETRSLGYSIYYIILFGSAALAGVLTDVILSVGNEDMQTFRYTFIYGLVVVVIAIGLTYFLRELDISNHGLAEIDIEKPKTHIMQDTRNILVLKTFWRFFGLASLLIFIRAIYSHINITLPLYMYRDIEDGAHFGYMIALHEVLTFIVTPLLTMLIYKFSLYSLFLIGGVFCSLSPLIFMFPASYFTVVIFVTVTSIGEAIHAPRLLDYTVEIAPKAKIGIFLSVAAIPLSLSAIIAGLMAGVLLERYCPDEGETECWKMWGIISLFACISLFLICVLRKWIEEPPYQSDPFVSCSRESKEHMVETDAF